VVGLEVGYTTMLSQMRVRSVTRLQNAPPLAIPSSARRALGKVTEMLSEANAKGLLSNDAFAKLNESGIEITPSATLLKPS